MGRVKALFIEPGCPLENGYVESFNGKLRDEFLNGEVFNTLAEAQILVEWWRREYNQERTHSAMGYPVHLHPRTHPHKARISTGPVSGVRTRCSQQPVSVSLTGAAGLSLNSASIQSN